MSGISDIEDAALKEVIARFVRGIGNMCVRIRIGWHNVSAGQIDGPVRLGGGGYQSVEGGHISLFKVFAAPDPAVAAEHRLRLRRRAERERATGTERTE